MKKAFYYETAIGRIGIAEQDGALTNIFFGNTVTPKEFIEEETPLLQKAAAQLREYAAGQRTQFDLPLAFEGTPFQQQVWKALLDIPYGKTCSYRQLAEAIGKPTACRAVGAANGRNPLSLVVPCHRVIGTNGAPVGYAGGLAMKKRLLDLEKR